MAGGSRPVLQATRPDLRRSLSGSGQPAAGPRSSCKLVQHRVAIAAVPAAPTSSASARRHSPPSVIITKTAVTAVNSRPSITAVHSEFLRGVERDRRVLRGGVSSLQRLLEAGAPARSFRVCFAARSHRRSSPARRAWRRPRQKRHQAACGWPAPAASPRRRGGLAVARVEPRAVPSGAPASPAARPRCPALE